MREIPVADGRRFVLHPLVSTVPSPEALLIAGNDRTFLVEVDFEGCISPSTAEILSEKSVGSCHSDTIFSNPSLAKSVFGWDCSVELAGLQQHLSEFKETRGLDVGCGYGRMLIPLIENGFSIDGIDNSLPLIRDLSATLGSAESSRAINARIEEYISPQAYGFAYAAMNTVRYLETKFALRAHLRCMAENLVSGGLYLFCISLTPQPAKKYDINWYFSLNGRRHQVKWSFYSYCHIKEQITEYIEIRDATSGLLVHGEYQIQGNYTLPYLRTILEEESSVWKWEGACDLAFCPVELSSTTRGTYWFKIRRL